MADTNIEYLEKSTTTSLGKSKHTRCWCIVVLEDNGTCMILPYITRSSSGRMTSWCIRLHTRPPAAYPPIQYIGSSVLWCWCPMIAQTIQSIPEIPNVAAATPCTTRDLPASVKNMDRRFITHIRVSYILYWMHRSRLPVTYWCFSLTPNTIVTWRLIEMFYK